MSLRGFGVWVYFVVRGGNRITYFMEVILIVDFAVVVVVVFAYIPSPKLQI